MTALFGLTTIPLLYLFARITWRGGVRLDWSSLGPTLVFALGGATVATILGGATGVLLGTREFPGRRCLLALSVLPIAAPPAFWWIGATRWTASWGNASGPIPAAVVAGLALSPVTVLLVFATLRQLPSNLYQAARVALPPATRLFSVLIPLLRSSLVGGFVLTIILLLGESELPFLFSFRTAMTDVVTTFAQTFNVESTVPVIIPLLIVILILGVLAGRPLMHAMLTASRGGHGVSRTPAAFGLMLPFGVPAAYVVAAVSGYAWAVVGAVPTSWLRSPVSAATLAVSVIEPVGSAWSALLLTVIAVYPARRSAVMPAFLWIALVLFCVPAAVFAIGWIGVSQRLGGMPISPIVAYTSRGVALAVLGFGVAYSRLPASLENAADLVPLSAVRRAWTFTLPLTVWSLAASSAMIAALTYADRDVASLLLRPGASRLTLDLYLASANAPSAVVGQLALATLVGAALTVAVAAAGPVAVWGRRG